MNTARIYLSAVRKSSGKTTIAIAINRIMADRGIKVQPFKKGPDFIDPMWHSQAAREQCYNLDFFFVNNKKRLKDYFVSKIEGKEIAIIEGNHGLFDDINILGGTDNAAMAKLTKSPIILIVDVKQMGRTVVPVIMGIKEFDKEINIAGIILNRVKSKRHRTRLEKAIKHYTGIQIVGSIPEDTSITVEQRHLGLSAVLNRDEMEIQISQIAKFVERSIDIDAVINIAKNADRISAGHTKDNNICTKPLNLSIAVAHDEAFNFYYKDNLDEIKRLGVEIVRFSPLHDRKLPDTDAVYLGGGFPELFAEELQNNTEIRSRLRKRIEEGLFVYAECGGLLYLTEDIKYNDKVYDMVGIFKTHTYFTKKPKGHGYIVLKPKNQHKDNWYCRQQEIRGHEFHHGYFDKFDGMMSVFDVIRGYGIDGMSDGIVYKNVLANFTHVHVLSSPLFFRSWFEHIQQKMHIVMSQSA